MDTLVRVNDQLTVLLGVFCVFSSRRRAKREYCFAALFFRIAHAGAPVCRVGQTRFCPGEGDAGFERDFARDLCVRRLLTSCQSARARPETRHAVRLSRRRLRSPRHDRAARRADWTFRRPLPQLQRPSQA